MGLPSTFLALIYNSVFQALVLIPLGLVALDLASGIAAAVARGNFDIQRLPDFLSHDILKYAGGAFLVLLSWFLFSSSIATTLTATLGMTALSLSVVNSIWDNLHAVFGHDPAAMAIIDVAASQVGLHDPGPSAPSAPSPGAGAVVPADPVGPGVPVNIGSSAVFPPASFDQWSTSQVPVLTAVDPGANANVQKSDASAAPPVVPNANA